MVNYVIVQLNNFAEALTRYVLIYVWFFGNIGTLLNIFIFLQRQHRPYTCSWYFICLALTHICILNISCLPLIIGDWIGFEYGSYSLAFCKIQSYLLTLSLYLSRHFLCLIAIDRWLVTSRHAGRRNQSSPRTAKLIILISLIFWSLYSIHAFIEYTSRPFGCVAITNSGYGQFASVDGITFLLLPAVVMMVFSFLTLSNIRHANKVHQIQSHTTGSLSLRTVPISVNTQHAPKPHRSKYSNQFLVLSLLQALTFVAFNAPRTCFRLFTALANADATVGSENWGTFASFFNDFSMDFIYTYTAITFFRYVLGSKVFRHVLIMACKEEWARMKRYVGR